MVNHLSTSPFFPSSSHLQFCLEVEGEGECPSMSGTVRGKHNQPASHSLRDKAGSSDAADGAVAIFGAQHMLVAKRPPSHQLGRCLHLVQSLGLNRCISRAKFLPYIYPRALKDGRSRWGLRNWSPHQNSVRSTDDHAERKNVERGVVGC